MNISNLFLRLGLRGFPLVIAITCTGNLFAQDFEAVQNRLLKAVKKDELTLEQAAVMMDALKHHSHEREMHEMEVRFHLEEREIMEMVESGKIDRRDAERRIGEMRGEIERQHMLHGRHEREEEIEIEHEHDGDHRHSEELHDGEGHDSDQMDDRKRQYLQGERRIKQAIENGRISQEDGEKRLMGLRQRLFEEKKEKAVESDPQKIRYQRAMESIKQAVENGRLSKADAEKRIRQMKERLESSEQAKGQSNKAKDRNRVAAREQKIAAMKEKVKAIRKAVEMGDFSREEARVIIEKMQKQVDVPLMERTRPQNRRDNPLRDRARDKRERDMADQFDMSDVRPRIQRAVREGSMDREQAREAQDRKRAGAQAKEKAAAIEKKIKAAFQRIDDALKAGRISDAEAKKQRARLKQRLGKDKE